LWEEQPNGESWKIGVTNPFKPKSHDYYPFDGAITTSGSYESGTS
jgi:thiamine biosynthesis lipoprotein